MPSQPISAPRIVERRKREIPIPLFGTPPPKRISNPSALAKAVRGATPRSAGLPSPPDSAVTQEPATAPAAAVSQTSAGDHSASRTRCNTCETMAIAAMTEVARLPALLAELSALADSLRSAMHAAPLPATPSPESAPPKKKRNYTPRKTDQKVSPLPLTERKWITIKQAAAIYPKSEQAWRHLVHQASQYLKYPKAGLPSNGFEKCIVRQPGSRNVYLIVEELDRWMATGQEGAQ